MIQAIVKHPRYINIFVMLIRDNDAKRIEEYVRKLCEESKGCVGVNHEVSRVVKGFHYYRVTFGEEVDEVPKDVVEKIENFIRSIESITWYKIETRKVV